MIEASILFINTGTWYSDLLVAFCHVFIIVWIPYIYIMMHKEIKEGKTGIDPYQEAQMLWTHFWIAEQIGRVERAVRWVYTRLKPSSKERT